MTRLLLALIFLLAASTADARTLVENGETNVRIVILRAPDGPHT